MERKSARFATVALAVIVGLLLVYPASVGPAGFLIAFIDWDSLDNPVLDSLNRVYSPLFRLPDPIGGWMVEWQSYGAHFGNDLRGR